MRTMVAGGDQPGVFDLLVTPQRAQGLAVPGEQFFGQLRHAVHVKQGAVGIKQHGTRGLWRGCIRWGGGEGHPPILGRGPLAIDRLPMHAAVTKRRVITRIAWWPCHRLDIFPAYIG